MIDRPTFVIRLRPERGTNGVLALKRVLKFALRACRMRALSVEEESTDVASNTIAEETGS
jgi:hypothetical protein